MTIPKELILNLLDSSNKNKQKSMLSQLTHNKDKEIIKNIISLFDDDDIKIRGEVFSILCLNENDISEILIDSLSNKSKNIRAFCSLILANRNDTNGISHIKKLTNDSSNMVRSCVLGALGHLRASNAVKEIHQGVFDSDVEVKKSAAHALNLLGEKLSNAEKIELEKQDDPDFEKILKKL